MQSKQDDNTTSQLLVNLLALKLVATVRRDFKDFKKTEK